MKIKILTYNNRVGIVTDAILLDKILTSEGFKTSIGFIDSFTNVNNLNDTFDIGVWIQNFDINLLNRFKKNIFFINEEWSGDIELKNLHLFDYVVCKSKYAFELIKHYNYKNLICLPFISRNFYNKSIIKSFKYLHFAGRSIQKNTELILNQTVPITLIDPYNKYKPNLNFNHVNSYQTENQLEHLLNFHGVHICCSLYESWGHYLFEGLSTGSEIICSDIPVFRENLDPDLVHFIPTVESVDMNYIYCKDNFNNTFPMRKSYFVDKNIFTNTIYNFSPKGNVTSRIQLYNSIVNNNSRKIIDFFKSI